LTPLVAIPVITGICALLYLFLTLIAKISHKVAAITQLDPKRGRQISIMILVASLGAQQLLDRWDRADRARSRSLDNKLTIVHLVPAVYPPLTRQARMQGTVRFTAIISAQGQVAELKLIQGNPMLVTAAQEAARQWVYSPPTAGGLPVKVKTEIDINFRLNTPR
jgi:TonB family protein